MKSRFRLALLVLIATGRLATADEIPLHDDSAIVLASVEQGRAVLGAEDRFTAELSRFDLESRLATNKEVTTKDLLKFAVEQVAAWGEADRKKLSPIIEKIRDRFAGLKLPFPKQVLLIKTTGKEEGGAAYCRGNAIILPRSRVDIAPEKLERLLAHELFHVLSSHNEKLRHALYQIVGYRPCTKIALPKEIADRKITNPDGPTLSYYIELEVDGQQRRAVPLLLAKSRFDPEAGGSFFRYLQFRLLAVEQEGDLWRPAVEDEQLVLFDPKEVPAYRRKIGNNTNYIIHPDEILADNFVHLVMTTEELPNPEIVERMRQLLRKLPNRQGRRNAVPPGFIAHRDIEYARVGDKLLLLDIYAPKESEQTRPLIVWIHGGAWRNGSKDRCPALRFLQKGFVVASINYRLTHEAIFPAQIHDCKAAIRWLRDNSEKYHIDAERIGVWGSSAGGHLVALLGTSGDVKQLEVDSVDSEQSSRVQAVCDFFGPTDFLQMDAHALATAPFKHDAPNSPESLLIGGPIQDNQEATAAANPVTYVSSDDPPFLIVHGDQDPLVPIHQSRLLVDALRQSQVEVTFHSVKGAEHGFRNHPEIGKLVDDFFAKQLSESLPR
jgi:acetyl esterase/lipase